MTGTVVAIQAGAVTTVKVELPGGARMTSSITNEAADELGLEVRKAVSVVVKASDVMLAVTRSATQLTIGHRPWRRSIDAVGRAGIRRRKPIRHVPKVSADFDMRAFGPEHSPNTVEGRIEAVGRMARGVRTMSNTQRRFLRRLIAVTIAALVVIALADWLLGRLFG